MVANSIEPTTPRTAIAVARPVTLKHGVRATGVRATGVRATGVRARRGTITVLAAVVMVAMLIVCSMVINLTQLATAKSEIRLASDAAAKAGAVILGQTQNIEIARAAAREIAAKHQVSGRSMRIRDIDVQFGNAEQNGGGRYEFTEHAEPIDSVLVNTRIADDALTSSGTFFMTKVLNPDHFSLDYTSVANRVDHDLCLVVDRSGSMAWNMSNQLWKYHVPEGEIEKSIIQSYFLPPDPVNSRWAALTRSTEVFFEHLDELPVGVHAGLVSYSSNFVFGLYTSEASTIESNLTADYEVLNNRMLEIGMEELIGNTNIASGMQSAVDVLTGEGSRLTAKGTMVVLTDGIWTQGKNPVEVAVAANAVNITVHAITFSEGADQDLMREVALAGGGNHYHAPDEESLRDIFAEIAQTLPSVLVQ